MQVKKPTYQDRLLNNMQYNVEYTLEDLLELLNVNKSKLIYVICALKKAIAQTKIRKVENKSVKTLYNGHTYIKI